MAAEAEGEGFRLGRTKTSRLHTLQYTGYPKKKVANIKGQRGQMALEDKIAQGPQGKVAQMATNFGLSIL